MARAYAPGDPRAAANGAKGGKASARTKKRRAFQKIVRAVGLYVTTEQAAIYLRGYRNGYSAAQMARARRERAA